MPQILASRTAKDARNILATRSSLARRGGEFVEMHVAIRLRPQANLPRDRFRQCVLEIELAIEIALYLVARDADFEVVPLPGCGRCVSDPFDRRSPAFFELPKDQIVFKAVRPDRQVVAVGLEIEQDAGALIDAARQPFEAHADFTIL